MDLNKTMNRMRKMVPGRRKGMSTGAKVMLMAVPVVVLIAVGKMISSRMHDETI